MTIRKLCAAVGIALLAMIGPAAAQETPTGFTSLALSGSSITSGSLLDVDGSSITSGNVLKLKALDATLSGGKYVNLLGGTGTTSVFSIGELGAVTLTGTIDPTVTCTTAGGDRVVQALITQDTGTALTGTLVGLYARATGGSDGGTGTMRGCEIGGRMNDSVTSADATTVTGGYFWADTKTKTCTNLRGVEVSLDGGAGGVATLASGIVIFNNSSGTQTTSVAVDVNEGNPSGRKAFTYDFRGQNAETLDNATNGTWQIKGAVNFCAAGGTAASSVGILHGAGASGAAYSLGAGAAGVKGMSYYLSSTSTTTTHSLEGLYINVDYGVGATSGAPFGEAGRFRARLMGDSVMTVAGSHSTVEWGQAGASTAGLVCGSRSNLVFVDSTAGGGTICGAQAELFSGGTSTDVSGARASIMRLVIDGSVTAAKFTVPVFEIKVPTDLVGDGLIVDTDATTEDCDAKLRIMINDTTYWIMLSDGHA